MPSTGPISTEPPAAYLRGAFSPFFAAFMEPSIGVGVYLGVALAFGEPIVRSDLTLCLLVFALTFPGRNRFWDRPLNAAVDISTSWLALR